MSDTGRKIINIIIALIVSIGAWTFVVYNNDPTTEVKYKDVPITFKGEDALANKGYGVSQASDATIDVTLRQRRIDTADISASSISVVADVTEAEEGENGISLKIKGPEGTQVAESEKSSISVEVEEADSAQGHIVVEYAGDLEGFEPVTSEITSSDATVLGAKSEIARVSKIAALVNFEETENKLKNFTCKLSALDSDGDVIDHVVIYPGEVNFYAYTGYKKEVTLNVAIVEEPEEQPSDDKDADTDSKAKGDGYTRTYTAPRTIVIKGAQPLIDDIEEISTTLIDINSMYEDQEISLEYELPDGVYLADESKDLTMKVKVTRNTEDDQ